jgi:hypothetical protein
VGPDGEYARFLAALVDLADASGELPRCVRGRLEVALLAACESDSHARAALLGGGPERLELAAARLRSARCELVEAERDVAADAARRRRLAAV